MIDDAHTDTDGGGMTEMTAAPDDFDPDDYDVPFADPAIRAGYRDALGRFIMAHNEVDFWLTGILVKATKLLAPDGSLEELAAGDFSQRLRAVTLITKTAPHISFGGMGNGRLGELNGLRNVLAHAHFNQDPFDGTYEIVKQRHRSAKQDRINNHNADSINAAAKELEEIASHMSAIYDFIDFPVPMEYRKDGAIATKSAELWEMMREEKAG